jgi:hypothetical protein
MAEVRMRAFDAPQGLALALGLILCGTGCPRNVDGSGHSGKDVRNKGAKRIKLEDNEGQSRKDIVTYPGGDRVDAPPPPADVTGTLKVTVRWKPPRPGLDLAFDVFDQYYHRIGRAKPTPDGNKRSKRVTIKDAGSGKYYVMVYAPRRMDAATYRVQVKFAPGDSGPVAVASASDVPDPPNLPALPEAVDPAIAGTTPPPGTGPGTQPTEAVPPPVPVVPPQKARVVKFVVAAAGGLVITVDKGKNQGIEAGWKGQVLNSSGRPLQGGDFVISKVRGGEAEGKVSLSVDQINANNRVQLSPPPP